jgi:hypothetical protein
MAAAADLGFVLYGGTAIALRLGHRQSVDFDLFTEGSLDRPALRAALPFLARATVVQDTRDALGVLVPAEGGQHSHVKVSFFGGIDFGRVGDPERTEDGVMLVASPLDLLATKVKVILQRAEAKDYRDVAYLLRAGTPLAQGLAAARALFGATFPPGESVKALTFFGDGDLASLTADERSTLVEAARAVRELPAIAVVSRSLGPGPGRG